MQRRTLLNQSLVATLLLSAAAAAFAGGGGGSNGSGRNQYPRPAAASSAQPVAQLAASSGAKDTGSGPSAAVNGWTPATDGSAGTGKTRAQVRAELLQAEKAGLIPTLNAEYPPSADTIARNQAQFQQRGQAWGADDLTGVAAR